MRTDRVDSWQVYVVREKRRMQKSSGANIGTYVEERQQGNVVYRDHRRRAPNS